MNMEQGNLRCRLAEFASELLRLQEQTGAEPRRNGAFAPEALRRWAESTCDSPNTPGGPARSVAAPCHEEPRVKGGESEAEATLLRAELAALRGKHEEEKRRLACTADDLRRRNEELESLVASQRADGKASNGRSASCIQLREGEAGGEGESTKFGLRMKAFAQRWTSPHPARGDRNSALTPAAEEEKNGVCHTPESEEGSAPGSCSSTINTNEDFGQELNEGVTTRGESLKVIAALEEQLRQSEHHAGVLQQRLLIVKESGDAVIQSLNEELADLAEDRARSEEAMIKELSVLNSQRREERGEYEKRIQDWISHDAGRRQEVEQYKLRIESLLSTVRMMNPPNVADCEGADSSSRDAKAEQDIKNDLITYIQLLSSGKRNGKQSFVMSINDAFDREFNANPRVADDMIEYYRSRPELKNFTLKSELPRMDYEVITVDGGTGKDVKLVSTDEIRSYFASLEEGKQDDEIEIIIRAANQSLLADPLAMLTGEGDGKLVHSGSFHSTVIATVCAFKLDLRHEGERHIKVNCELAICVPSGLEPDNNGTEDSDENEDKVSATLELARANLLIQFSPSPTSTPSGPLVKYYLVDIKPTLGGYEGDSDNARAIQSAAVVLARDHRSHIGSGMGCNETRSNVKSLFLSKMKQFSSHRNAPPSESIVSMVPRVLRSESHPN